MSFFEAVESAPEDPIMNLPFLFAADHRKQKVNLGVGSYRTASGKPYILTAVHQAEEALLNKKMDKEYLPIEGSHAFLEESLKLTFGDNFDRGHIHALQTVGGASALRLGAEFLSQEIAKLVFIPNYTWLNHEPIFAACGYKIESYPYYDIKKHRVDFDAICAKIRSMPAGSILLLQASCQNPTGADLTFEQWKELSSLIKNQRIFPFFDIAYQGFGDGIEQDVKAVRYFLEQDHEMFVAITYSKSFGLYSERVGSLAIVNRNLQTAQKVLSQIKHVVRTTYSNPPSHGAYIISTILTDPALRKEWVDELTNMRGRIYEMRLMFSAGFQSRCENPSLAYMSSQKGFFSLVNFDKDQIHRLRLEKAIYLPINGRLNFAGLNPENIDYVIDAFLSVTNEHSYRR